MENIKKYGKFWLSAIIILSSSIAAYFFLKNEPLLYFGSIVGPILGVMGTYLLTINEIRKQEVRYESDKFDNSFFNLFELFRNKQESELVQRKIKEFLNEIQKISNYYEIPYIEKLSKELTPFVKAKVQLDKLEEQIELIEKQEPEMQEKFNEKQAKIFNPEVSYSNKENEIKEKVEEIGNKFHPDLGTYFRTFYIIVDLIFQNKYLHKNDKAKYLRILRSILSTDELLAIFYNINYYSRGKKLKDLLLPEDIKEDDKIFFFSSKDDIRKVSKAIQNKAKNISTKTEDFELTYFNYEQLLFKVLDFSKLK
jgi:hypothetical protein